MTRYVRRGVAEVLHLYHGMNALKILTARINKFVAW